MKSLVVKRSVVFNGHKTSVSLEDAFWSDLKEIARTQRATLSTVIMGIDKGRQQGSNLSSAIRVFVFDQVRARGELCSRIEQDPQLLKSALPTAL
jgi:predicted DNA-binding ribbon-helix-helix protein